MKWPWQAPQPPLGEPELSPAMKARLDALEERCKLQEKGLKALELDWQEWFDKFRLMYARLSKRIKDATEAVGPLPDTPPSYEDAPETPIDRAEGVRRAPQVQRGPRRNYG